MAKLKKFKQWILSKVKIRQLIHYSKDLRGINCDDMYVNNAREEMKDLKICYYKKILGEIFNELETKHRYLIEDDTTCLVARLNNEVAGYFLLNLNGKRVFCYPFKHLFTFGDEHAYGFGLFIKPQFRSRGIAKQLYLASFKILKNQVDYLDIFVEKESFVANKLVEKLGFKKIKDLAMIKLFFIKFIANFNNDIEEYIFNLFYKVGKLAARIAALPFRLYIQKLRQLNELIDSLFWQAYILEHQDKSVSLKAAFVCNKIYGAEIFDRIFMGPYVIRKIKTFFRENLITEINNIFKSVDMVIIDGTFGYLYKKLSCMKGMVFIPKWVTQKNHSFTDLNEFKNNRNRNAYGDIRSILKNKYSYVFTKDLSLLRFFYDEMYVPYINKRYKKEKYIISFSRVRKSFDKGGLLLIEKEGRYVSGSIIEFERDVFHPICMGLLNADTRLLKEDAFSALYYFELKLAGERGFHNIDYGLSRAFLNDGVLLYKSKWNTKIEFDKKRSSIFAMKINKLTDSLKSFLINNPFISLEKDGLVENFFIDPIDSLDFNVLYKRYFLNGIKELKVQIFDDNKKGTEILYKTKKTKQEEKRALVLDTVIR